MWLLASITCNDSIFPERRPEDQSIDLLSPQFLSVWGAVLNNCVALSWSGGGGIGNCSSVRLPVLITNCLNSHVVYKKVHFIHDRVLRFNHYRFHRFSELIFLKGKTMELVSLPPSLACGYG